MKGQTIHEKIETDTVGLTESRFRIKTEQEPTNEEEVTQVFINIQDNEYRCKRNICKYYKDIICECTSEHDNCAYKCLNRNSFIECNMNCPSGKSCSNRSLQNKEYAQLDVFRTKEKGMGIRARGDISAGSFLIEYVGEILNKKQFKKRAKKYKGNKHHYIMQLNKNQFIDSTRKGNLSRFINQACEPNSEAQRWMVNGEYCIGIFSKQEIKAKEEITLNYRYETDENMSQICFCTSKNCCGKI